MQTAKGNQKCKQCYGKGTIETKRGDKRRCIACRGTGVTAGNYRTKAK